MQTGQLSPAEIERRLPLWKALSEIFLDTTIQLKGYQRIAEIIDCTDFTQEEVLFILKRDVAPAFVGNLMSITGEWAGWTESEVLRRVGESRGRLSSRIISATIFRRYIEKEWEVISNLLEQTN